MEKNNSWTVVSRDPNSWTRTQNGDYHEITYECGHRHRTLVGAVRCLRQLEGTTASIHARIEGYAQDQKYSDGPVIHRSDDQYHAAEQEIWKSGKRS